MFLYSFLIYVHDVREVRPCCLRHCAQDFQNNALRRIILRLLSNTKWILKSFMALSLNSSPISPYTHILSLFSFLPCTHYLSKHVSYTLPYCFYLCSPILLLFLTMAHQAQTDCRPTSYIHCKLIYINVLYKAILYYL